MRFTVLGPVRAWVEEREVPLGPPQQRAVVTALLLRRGRAMGMAELIEAVWGEGLPSDPVAVVRTYVSRLRKALEPGRAHGEPPRLLVSVADGYALRADKVSLDLAVFEGWLADARQRMLAGDLAGADELLHAALAEWDGTPLAGVPGPFAVIERERLVESRLAAVELQLSVSLAQGRHEDVIAEIASLRKRHPLREHFSELLMLALYRSGRQAEALDTYQSTRRALTEKLGVEPGRALRDLHNRLLVADPALTQTSRAGRAMDGAVGADARRGTRAQTRARTATPGHVRPYQLPADLPDFTGRIRELSEVQKVLRDEGGPAVVTISGMAGIGKTMLAVHWAHRLAERFPDGTLFINLRGFDSNETGLDPTVVIRQFLDALDMAPHKIPADLHAQTALYRSLLAGLRVLIVLDNARDAEQVRPLLPGSSGSFVIVTSRNKLHGLVASEGAHPLSLGLLSPEAARELLRRRISSGRVEAEPRAVDDIVKFCGGLPLALAIVAARAALQPGFSLAVIAAELADAQGSLDAFVGTDTATDARTVFSWSFLALTPEEARLFQLLSLHPGPEISVSMAASIAAVTPREARTLLFSLAQDNLLTEIAPGRYVVHDLLRAYATELAAHNYSEAERHQAENRLLDHLMHTAMGASTVAQSWVRGPRPAGPADLGPLVKTS
ncbi:BTAD domain-containing putative transcriptional regulator [Streptomyces sp. NPDC001858]